MGGNIPRVTGHQDAVGAVEVALPRGGDCRGLQRDGIYQVSAQERRYRGKVIRQTGMSGQETAKLLGPLCRTRTRGEDRTN